MVVHATTLNLHKDRPQGEPKLGKIARQYVCVLGNVPGHSDDRGLGRFWLSAIRVSSPGPGSASPTIIRIRLGDR